MLVQIRKMFLVFFFLFSLNSFSFAVNVVPLPTYGSYNNFNYTSSFITKAKYVAALIHSYYMYQKDYSDVYIPVKVRYKTYFDLLLFGIKTSNAYTWAGYCYNDPSNSMYLSYYMYSNFNSAIAITMHKSNVIEMWCSNNNFPMIQPVSWLVFYPVPGGLQVNGEWVGQNVNTRVPVSGSYPVYVSYNVSQFREYFAQTISGVSNTLNKPILASIDLDARSSYVSSLSTDVPMYKESDINSTWQYPENGYLGAGYLDASDSDIVSTAPAVVVPSTSYVYAQMPSSPTFVNFSTPVPVQIF
jgi:hypothetical protein